MGMIMRFLGTGASEGIPDPFCSCPICENAWQRGGQEIRMRSAFRVTDEVQIDFGPDSFAQSVFFGNELRSLKHLLITHAHDDHLAMFELELIRMVNGDIRNEVRVYLTDNNYRMLKEFDAIPFGGKPGLFIEKLAGKMAFIKLDFGKEYEIGDLIVMPVRAAHECFFGSEGANYLVRLADGKKLLYAVDTGYYSEETLETLKNIKLDYLIAECTRGTSGGYDRNHMNIDDCNALFEAMRGNGAITDATRIYLTHISHKQSFGHVDMVNYYEGYHSAYPITVAYDGLIIK